MVSQFREEISAGGIVYKKEIDKTVWLLIQPSTKKWWGFPKGRVGDTVRNETHQEAALREVKEETGVTAKIISEKPFETHYIYWLQKYLIKKTVRYFLMEYLSGSTEDHDHEVADAKWVSAEDAHQLLTYDSDKEAFMHLSQ